MSNLLGIIIKVHNLEVMRKFYRDILNLGDPVLDSNFWVEFKLPSNNSLFLEKLSDNSRPEIVKGKISWVCESENPKQLIEKLKNYDYDAEVTIETQAGYKLIKFFDPEGNPFFIKEDNQ